MPSVFYNDTEIREVIQHVQDAEHLFRKARKRYKKGARQHEALDSSVKSAPPIPKGVIHIFEDIIDEEDLDGYAK